MTGSRGDARVLIVDDQAQGHSELREILMSYRVDSAFSGQEALQWVHESLDADDPYALAIVDLRQPPSWDGLETIANLWTICPRLQAILHTSSADCTWHDMLLKLSTYDAGSWLMLRSPYERIELLQMVNTLIRKWQAAAEGHAKLQQMHDQLQAEIAHREKMSSELELSQRLAASVGHELRNPLAAIRNANAFITKRLGATAEPRVVQFLDLIDRELYVCTKIITDLLDFARVRRLNLNLIELRDLIDEAVAMVPLKGTQLLNTLPHDLPMAVVDREQFRQVVINLVQNAADALELHGGGQITISAGCTGGVWQLVVEDNGPGMSAELVRKVFEPLFTTKIKGTGLGLAIVANIIKSHNGEIRIESEPGKGTRCVVQWPEPDRIPEYEGMIGVGA